ncbi:MAG: hypothetical protein H0T80_02150, partial [Betaproteobacteria bacterium]|nr:hypothetical protein [Betaproteobacteria bacterium]
VGEGTRRMMNSDPITGQAAWFDLRVKLTKCAPGETGAWPRFDPLPAAAVERPAVLRWPQWANPQVARSSAT